MCDKRYGTHIVGVEMFLWETFFPRLLFEKPKAIPPIVVTISAFLVKKAGMSLQNPVTSPPYKYTNSLHMSYDLIGTVTGKKDFSSADHLW